jgi:RimJ/RimL family protein N-acetyltransferase
MYLETERLIIRSYTMNDLDAIHKILDQDLDYYTKTREERESWLRWTIDNEVELRRMYNPPYSDYAVTLSATGEVIGGVGFVPSFGPFGALPYYVNHLKRPEERRNSTEFGLFWAIGRLHQRQGYATEAGRTMLQNAFRTLNLQRIVATTEYDNESSMAVMRRLGMTIEKNPYRDPFWFQVVGILENPGKSG